MTIQTVEAHDGDVVLTVRDDQARDHRSFTLRGAAFRPAIVARLDGWATLRTPLLMMLDEDGDAHLFGPDAAVTRLDVAGNRAG